MELFFEAYQGPPASSITTRAPAWVSAYAAMPPPAPEPMIQTSYAEACRRANMQSHSGERLVARPTRAHQSRRHRWGEGGGALEEPPVSAVTADALALGVHCSSACRPTIRRR